MMKWDEQNKLKSDVLISPINIHQYFDEMEIEQEQKDEREEFARHYVELLLFVFSLINTMSESDTIDWNFVMRMYESGLDDLCNDYFPTGFMSDDVKHTLVFNTLRVNENHFDENKDYYTSYARATYLSVNHTNTLANSKDMKNAIDSGFNKKKWVTERDQRVRKTHKEAEGEIVNISEPFVVGESLLMFPGDVSLGADDEEIANCRCTVEYL